MPPFYRNTTELVREKIYINGHFVLIQIIFLCSTKQTISRLIDKLHSVKLNKSTSPKISTSF